MPLRPTSWPIKLQWQPLVGQNYPDGTDLRYGFLTIQLVRSPRAARHVYYTLKPPAVVNPPATGFVAPPIRVTLADSRSHTKTVSSLGAPVVVQSPALAPEIRTTLVKGFRPQAGYGLSPPAVVNPVPTPPPIRVSFTRLHRPARTYYRLAPPTVLATPTVVPPIRTTFVSKRRTGRTLYRFGAPVVPAAPIIPFIANPVDVRLAPTGTDARFRYRTHYHLYPPAVVDQPFVPPPAVVAGVDDFTPIIPTMM
jgi:hypothetical protein